MDGDDEIEGDDGQPELYEGRGIYTGAGDGNGVDVRMHAHAHLAHAYAHVSTRLGEDSCCGSRGQQLVSRAHVADMDVKEPA